MSAPAQTDNSYTPSYHEIYKYQHHLYPLFKYVSLENINKTTSKIFSIYHALPWQNDKDAIEWFFYTEKPAIKEFLLDLYLVLLSEFTPIQLINSLSADRGIGNIYLPESYNFGIYMSFNADDQKRFNVTVITIIEILKRKLIHQTSSYHELQLIEAYRVHLYSNFKKFVHLQRYARDAVLRNINQSTDNTDVSVVPSIDIETLVSNIVPMYNELWSSFHKNYDSYNQTERLQMIQLIATFFEIVLYALPISHDLLYAEHEHHDKSLLRAGINLSLENILGIPPYIFSYINLQDVETGQVHNFDYHHFNGYLRSKRRLFSSCNSIKVV
jgi:hypothetical protein